MSEKIWLLDKASSAALKDCSLKSCPDLSKGGSKTPSTESAPPPSCPMKSEIGLMWVISKVPPVSKGFKQPKANELSPDSSWSGKVSPNHVLPGEAVTESQIVRMQPGRNTNLAGVEKRSCQPYLPTLN